jgi:hypothetical protein
MAGFFASFWHFFAFGGFAGRTAFCECLSCFLPFRRLDLQFFQKMVYDNCSSPDDRRARCEKYRLSRFYRVHLISKEMDRMTNKKFKLAAMSLALTACVAASPLSAGAEAPEAAADVQPSAAADTATEDKPSPETVAAEEPAAEAAADPVEETPAQSTEEPPAQEPEAAPAGDAAVLPALPGARPVVVDMPAAEAPADAAGEPAEAAPLPLT